MQPVELFGLHHSQVLEKFIPQITHENDGLVFSPTADVSHQLGHSTEGTFLYIIALSLLYWGLPPPSTHTHLHSHAHVPYACMHTHAHTHTALCTWPM